MLEVRVSNHAAKKLYESFHFQAYATRKSYYTNPTEDAILMTLEPLARHIQKGGMSAADQLVGR
jgi:ribosomal-protein-alanine N-acetyltransferase